MIDFARIVVIAGRGGDGAGSFTHIKGKRRGKADGGDGGRGGHIYLEATGDLNTLERFRYVKEYRAKNGGNGAPRRRKGAEGEDLVIKVPLGTVVKVRSSKFEVRSSFDLLLEDKKVLIAGGGQGGRGNNHLRDEFGRRPFSGEKGQDGEIVNLTLELKLIADVGLIGFPNAGKSTLLKVLTAAKVKIAAYPFTTLEPNLGVMKIAGPATTFLPASARSRLGNNGNQKNNVDLRAVGSPSSRVTRNFPRVVIADIPGLIEGASKGKGLGDLFLRHIERTKILVHLIDVSTSQDVWSDYQTIRGELKNYSRGLVKKKEIIVLNKIDLAQKAVLDNTLSDFKKRRKRVVAISALTGEGFDSLIKSLAKVMG